MPELETPTPPSGASALTQREKRDLQKAQLRPLANRRPELYEEDEYSSDEYERMMDMYNGTLASIEEGEIVKSRVLEIRDNMVVLDIGFKSEGTIPLEEFKDLPDLKAGDEVEVLLEHLEDQEGHDRIAWNYSHDFADIFDLGLPRLRDAAKREWPAPLATTSVYLGFLSTIPDTLIERKFGHAQALEVQAEAKALAAKLNDSEDRGEVEQILKDFDRSLKSRGLNPGTSADLTVATLFAASVQALELSG